MRAPAVAVVLLTCLPLAGLARQNPYNLRAERIVFGLQNPVYAAVPPGEHDRLFVVEKNSGLVRIVRDGQILGTPFLDLSGQVSTAGMRGLQCIAFHPEYASNGYFYVKYSDVSGPTLVERYTASPDPDVADPNSGVLVLGPLAQASNKHLGGCLQFGPDGMLYIGMGDGFDHTTAQDGLSVKGKMLRLDIDLPYPHVPTDNPFVGDPDVDDLVWSFGLREPWRFSFDRETGDLYIGDVGDLDWEEISVELAGSAGGKNFGWPCMEGPDCTVYPDAGCTCLAPELVMPIEAYHHLIQGGNSVIGGYVYRGCAIPEMRGRYVYCDYGSAEIFSFTYDGQQKGPTVNHTADLDPGPGLFLNTPCSFAENALGELFVVDLDGEIYQIVPFEPIEDCNTNGVPDACDIASGASCDNDGNGVPDECEGGAAVVTYCTAKAGLYCGAAAIGFSGFPSASATSGFDVFAGPARGFKGGFLLYGLSGRAALPFQGGLLCVDPTPLRRSVGRSSGGTLGQCDGQFSVDMNAFAQGLIGGSPDPGLLEIGNLVNGQWWGRDTIDNGSFLSDGIEYPVCP